MPKGDIPPIEEMFNRPQSSHSKDRVAYCFNHDAGNFHYGQGHPMKPPRLTLTHNLVMNYGLYKHMDVFHTRRAFDEEIANFHSQDYIEFLKRVTPNNVSNFTKFLSRFNLGIDDCPIFDGMYDFCRLSCGGSLEAARKLTSGQTNLAINWSGGLHHARKSEASGFCYTNDIVLAALELLRYFPRVLYVDIDVHHGDGVQEAFYASNRVLSVSFHKYDGHFFPGTGSLDEIGTHLGKYYSLNVPLLDYIDDNSYAYIFKHVLSMVIETFRPGAIIMQCGTDSLAGDKLGTFNISVHGHGECVRFLKSFNIPLMTVGGGGYTIRNVSRCWTYETSIMANTPVPDALPESEYMEYFGPDYRLNPPIVDSHLENANSRDYLDQLRIQIAEILRYMETAPSVQMQELPPDLQGFMENGGNWKVDEEEDDIINDTLDYKKRESPLYYKRRDKELTEAHINELYDDSNDQDHDGNTDDELEIEV